MIVSCALLACQPSGHKKEEPTGQTPYKAPEHHSESLTKVLDAHGGYERWSNMKTLSYTRGDEATITNLKNRKIRLESPLQTIGFDGEHVWVVPDTADASNARFYHNLYFYFFSMPFVVGDPGAFYEDMKPRPLLGKTYHGIKVSYGENVGDAPDDNYILWYDPQTNKMEWLMYTVTYRDGAPSDDYHLIKYNEWKEINGLLLPTSMQWYQFGNDKVGNMRKEVVFDKIQISTDTPADSLFIMPKGAQIAPLNVAKE